MYNPKVEEMSHTMEENCDERESVSRGVLAATSTLQMLLKVILSCKQLIEPHETGQLGSKPGSGQFDNTVNHVGFLLALSHSLFPSSVPCD